MAEKLKKEDIVDSESIIGALDEIQLKLKEIIKLKEIAFGQDIITRQTDQKNPLWLVDLVDHSIQKVSVSQD